ncbi:MAG: efflux RND transporter periplasmic adaptor subunit [Phycisphaerae bacterium]|nr:efflux RND transporter periplasmic adaptor subunit [Phycisphaerae bacterium]
MTSSPSTAAPAGSRSVIAAESRKAKRRTARPVLIVALSILLAGILGGAGWAAWSLREQQATIASADKFTVIPRTFDVVLKEKGELKAAKSTDIICEVEGRTTIISLIEEGAYVEPGDVLVRLASDAIEQRIQEEELKEANAVTAYEAAKTELDIQRDKNASDIRKALLDIQLKELELDKYLKGEWVQQRRDADIAIEQAEITLKNADEDYQASQQLYDRDFTTKTDYQQAEFAYKKAGWDLQKAQLAKTVLTDYTHVAQLTKLQSDLEEARKEHDRVDKNAKAEETKKQRDMEGKKRELELIQSQLAKLRTQLSKTTIVAPTAGFVVYGSGDSGFRWGNNDQIREGAEVYERQVLMQVPDTSRMLVVVRVHESKTDRLALGQPARVTVEGVPNREFTGTVTKIGVVAATQSRWLNPDLKEYETEISLDPSEVPLKPGNTALATILVETVTDKLAVPVQAIYNRGRQRYVFKQDGADIEPTSITLGATGTEFAEVSAGLQPGDQVLLAFGDNLKRMIPETGPENGRPGGPPAGAGGSRRGRPSGAPAQAPRGGAQGRPTRPAGVAPAEKATQKPESDSEKNADATAPKGDDDKATITVKPKGTEGEATAPQPNATH